VHGARDAAATADVDVEATLAWRDFMVSDYSDAGQERWLADTGIDLLRGSGRLAGTGVVEVDGARYHGHHLAVRRDHARDAGLQLRGYAVLRFTWQEVVRGPARVIGRITRLLDRPGTRRAS
jgi:hypothetical protein